MIEINLLPGARKKPARREAVDMSAALSGLSGRFRDKVLIGSVVAGLAGAGALGWMYTTSTAREAKLVEDSNRAQQDSVRFSALFAERTRVEAMRDTLLRQVNLIRTIDQDRYIWPHIMDEISRALPQYTWLTDLAYSGTPQGATNPAASPPTPPDTAGDPKKPRARKRLVTEIPPDPVTVRLMGRTVDIQALPRFWNQLEASPFLSGVNIEVSQNAVELGQPIVQFTMTVNYSRPDTSQLRRVPLVVKAR
jgi:Tfp pilus assembly protein PilN